ncbi:dTMP kinase [Melissococcus plutonius]|uniref:Thymidylate kinase n=2 Tax=Melissococcus plutonius TaxID=33970 RepID=F3Y9A4_MELPT|nr:dTMP kinase [Melissococcus plutonius]BAL62522.1 thymidylate kinase [Melissococcus plutonius DAT561]AIM24654.1 thymidylate kinase Tmk [Melissococcus plutonius S1]KMT24752.1 thymidylate kinase Tmk [Melissococcus plutonius]KMT26389.1 thymidylate kinase Tmk [Melissococcus plutonius]KMT27639.1 thymidylate kinase Tmk [Melissococcus plutonius]
MKGLFITIEGPDGAGKTSVLNELYPKLDKVATQKIVRTREPGGSLIAEKIRQIILDPKSNEMDERTEALLYTAARRQHLIEKILPALESGKIVICDRFLDSSLAYQGAGRRIGVKAIAEINEFAIEGTVPDFTIYLDVDSDTGLHRIQNSHRRQFDRLDNAGLEFHQRVRHEYLKLVDENPQRIVKVDARMCFKEVVEKTYYTIVDRFPEYFEN